MSLMTHKFKNMLKYVRHVYYVGPYMHKLDAEDFVEIVPGVEGEEWRVEIAILNGW